jgi:hypothetical protein
VQKAAYEQKGNVGWFVTKGVGDETFHEKNVEAENLFRSRKEEGIECCKKTEQDNNYARNFIKPPNLTEAEEGLETTH